MFGGGGKGGGKNNLQSALLGAILGVNQQQERATAGLAPDPEQQRRQNNNTFFGDIFYYPVVSDSDGRPQKFCLGITASMRNLLQQIDPELSTEGKPVLRFLPVPCCRMAGEAISEICGTLQLLEEDGKSGVMKKLLSELVGVVRKAEYNTDGKALPDWFHEIDWNKIKSQGEGGRSGGGASSNQKETELELQLRIQEAQNRSLELRLAEARHQMNATSGEGGKGGAGVPSRLLRARRSDGDTGAPASKSPNTTGGTRFFNMGDDVGGLDAFNMQARGSYGRPYDSGSGSSSSYVQRASATMEIKLTAVQHIQREVGARFNIYKSGVVVGGSARQAERAVSSLLDCIGKGYEGVDKMLTELLTAAGDVDEFFDLCTDNLESAWEKHIAEEMNLFGSVDITEPSDLLDIVRIELPGMMTTIFQCNPCCPKFWEKLAEKLGITTIKDIDKDENQALMLAGCICLGIVRHIVKLEQRPKEGEEGINGGAGSKGNGDK
eukprot:g9159.t1